ncbi:MAG: serine protease [Alphaproteobacteria bacterium]|nr:serine protease [Alphaproteobacteria bacterium]
MSATGGDAIPNEADMRSARRSGAGIVLLLRLRTLAAATLMLAAAIPSARAQSFTIDDLVGAVVRIKTFINPDGRSVQNLGRERQGSGIVIDENGLVLTIGYLMLEAHAAELVTGTGRTVPANVVGYDHDTGFGLLRAIEPLKIKPLAFGKADTLKLDDPALVVSFGGAGMMLPVHVASRRTFTGSWEYLIESAIYTMPPHPQWSGAALVSREGKLVGVGSLIVGNAKDDTTVSPGNMFVPIDGLFPIMGDLLHSGRVAGPGKPWLGVNTQELGGKLFVARVTPGSPAEKAGLKRGDQISGVKGEPVNTMADFYRKLWALGAAGISVPLDVRRNGETQRMEIPSANRMDHLKLKSTF